MISCHWGRTPKALLVILALTWSFTTVAEGDWAIETVEAEIRRGTDSSLVLDSQGYAHISYLEVSYPDDDGNLMYAYEDAAGVNLLVAKEP